MLTSENVKEFFRVYPEWHAQGHYEGTADDPDSALISHGFMVAFLKWLGASRRIHPLAAKQLVRDIENGDGPPMTAR